MGSGSITDDIGEERARIWAGVSAIEYQPGIAADNAAKGAVVEPEERLASLKRQIRNIVFPEAPHDS